MHDVLSAVPVEPAHFRKLMGQFATGVCVVSTAAVDGTISGITVNSLVSVSLEPLLVCWSLGNASSQFAIWSEAESFAISILGEDQQDLAMRYATRGSAALEKDDFIHTPQGLPVIGGALGYLECRRWSLYPAGDHTMVFGEVVGINQAAQTRPLGFYGGSFCRIAE